VSYSGVPVIPIVDWLGATEKVEWVPVRSSFSRTKVGEPLPRTELYVLDVTSKSLHQVETGEDPDHHIHIVGWRIDGSELLFLRASRTLQKLELMAANPTTGDSRVVLTETGESFVNGINIFFLFDSVFRQLDANTGFVWMSERDGWNNLYHYDFDGSLVRRLTSGELPVRGIEAVDDTKGYVYFSRPDSRERPYDKHLFRVSLTGEGMSQLTEGPGQHDIQFSPSRQFFLDTHSSLDIPPVTHLRRADGTLIQTLTRADISALEELQWTPPEEFVIDAADGNTDLSGVLYTPYDFDPDKRYPVIESVYGCPHENTVPRRFSDWRGLEEQALAQLGFVVFKVDARGTPKRGKDFQDVVYGNMGRHEIQDHMTALKQLADTRPYMDLTRVGITGHSCGGYFTIRSLLQAPDVYHVGVAMAPIADLYYGNAMEVYMGLPEDNGEAYEYASNLPLAGNLEGKLLMVHGTHDFSAPFSQTVRMAEAFIRAGKHFDLLVLPGQDHFYWYEEEIHRYVQDATRRYFVEHLDP
jgi:dipeptidyl aminopeptidase/acylaminoacyl peptidase